MLKQAIEKLIISENLTADEIAKAMDEVIQAENEPQIAAFLALLRAKGETATEVSSIVKSFTATMKKVETTYPVLDIVGTGGDGFNTINISTGSAILAAACGVKIAKHGNRSVSSLCGSADVLQQLGVNIEASANEINESINLYNFGFCFAPQFHPAFVKLKKLRTNLGVATIFNILGPLLNPATAKYIMIGVLNQDLLQLVADVIMQTDVTRALVFHGQGLDEISCVGPVEVVEINAGKQKKFTLNPKDYGLAECLISDLQGGAPEFNAEILRNVFKGETGPVANTLIFNAGVANYIYNITSSIDSGVALAKEKHADGSAYKLLTQLIAHTDKSSNRKERSHD